MLPLIPVQYNVPIVDNDGKPTQEHQRRLQAIMEQIEDIKARLAAAGIT